MIERFQHTQLRHVAIGERRRPDPKGKAEYARVDTLDHLGNGLDVVLHLQRFALAVDHLRGTSGGFEVRHDWLRLLPAQRQTRPSLEFRRGPKLFCPQQQCVRPALVRDTSGQ